MQHLGYQSNTLQILPSAQPCHDYRTIVQHSRVLFRGIRVLFALEHPARRVLFRGIRVVLFALDHRLLSLFQARFLAHASTGRYQGPQPHITTIFLPSRSGIANRYPILLRNGSLCNGARPFGINPTKNPTGCFLLQQSCTGR